MFTSRLTILHLFYVNLLVIIIGIAGYSCVNHLAFKKNYHIIGVMKLLKSESC